MNIKIGLIGFGTVGAGVVQALQEKASLLTLRTGITLELARIADLDIASDRGVNVDRSLLTTDANSILTDPSIQIVIELIGGIHAARNMILCALEHGKSVVTANKALLAEHGVELYEAAQSKGCDLFYEASVGGGIPVIKALREGLVVNHIQHMYGILNGTCNYILTRMEREGMPFEQVLREAQEAGYAEADPGLDIDGFDTAHKAAILTSLSYGVKVKTEDIPVQGIRGLSQKDIVYARELGYRIKLLASIVHCDGQVEVSVGPTLVAEDHMLASVHHVYNAVMITGDIVGDTLYYGRGAGRLPTASAVVADVVDAARNLCKDAANRLPPFVAYDHYGALRNQDEVRSRYYFRMPLLNRPGVFAQVASVFGRHAISIASVVQKEAAALGEYVPVIFLTQFAPERNYRAALEEIGKLDVVNSGMVRFRILAHAE